MTPRLMRSLLFVPASQPAKIEKAAASAADAVCVDLEDSVVTEEKPQARRNAVHALRTLDFRQCVRIVRVNALDTAFTYRDLVDVVEGAGDSIDVIMVPKVNAPDDLAFVDTMLTQIEKAVGVTRRIGLQAQIETARGWLYAREIAAATSRLVGLVFGPGDFAASMRMPSGGIGELDEHDDAYPGHRWHAVMHTVVAAARANDVQCMDGPYAGYKDDAGLERACRLARALGFDGKQCIHPAQLATVNAIFAPTDEEFARAAAIVEAYDQAVAAGQGAASFEGKMIDAASLRMAQAVLERR